MPRKRTALSVQDFGPIGSADVVFGDLTVLVGPQATGKSVFLQLLKLALDPGVVLASLKNYGLDWKKDIKEFLDIYLGEGMRDAWNGRTSEIRFNQKKLDLKALVSRQKRSKTETAFFIPAQRVLTISRGWPRPFTDYSPGDPFVVRDFSEKLRVLMESDLGKADSLFPQTRRLKKEERNLLGKSLFSDFELRVDKHGAQKRLVLASPDSDASLPFMVWSAGQREFIPLLLGMYWLLPPTKVARRGDIEWVIIEELEMGLHPQAISTVLTLVFDLLSRDYRVCLSTHSTHVLDVIWALHVCREYDSSPTKLLEVLGIENTQVMRSMAEKVISKIARVYYFTGDSREAIDISKLDPGAVSPAEAGWGGLTEFSGRVANVVADVVAEGN